MSGVKSRAFIISILLMMMCVQTFSMHTHLTHEASEHHSHVLAHGHAAEHDSDHASGHTDLEHDDETSSEIQGALLKQLLSLDFLVYFLLFVVLLDLARSHRWHAARHQIEWCLLLFLRPPLRAPPF